MNELATTTEKIISTGILYQYQTLIGSALGLVGLGFGFGVKNIYEGRKERKECLRRVEIGITRSLEDTCKTKIKLKNFIFKLRFLITEISNIQDVRHFSLETINFPTIRDIYRDPDAPNFKIKSYYLHNKLLWADAGIKETNEVIVNLKNDFIDLLRKNEFHVSLIRQNQKPDPATQRKNYAENLESFTKAIEEFVDKFIPQGIEIMIQIKIYNEHLRKKHGYGLWFLWKHEGIKLKYFRNKKEQKKFAKNLDSLDRIDKKIKTEVESLLKEIEERSNKLSK